MSQKSMPDFDHEKWKRQKQGSFLTGIILSFALFCLTIVLLIISKALNS